MMLCKILENFNGSQDGLVTTSFVKGQEVDISDYLMGCINKNWVLPLEVSQETEISTEAKEETEISTEAKEETEISTESKEETEISTESKNETKEISNKAIITDGNKKQAKNK